MHIAHGWPGYQFGGSTSSQRHSGLDAGSQSIGFPLAGPVLWPVRQSTPLDQSVDKCIICRNFGGRGRRWATPGSCQLPIDAHSISRTSLISSAAVHRSHRLRSPDLPSDYRRLDGCTRLGRLQTRTSAESTGCLATSPDCLGTIFLVAPQRGKGHPRRACEWPQPMMRPHERGR